MKSPFISIILPVFQVENYISQCLYSIIDQTFLDFELVVIDDCGTDDSIEIAHRILDVNASFPIRWLRHDYNRGLSAARNTGLDSAEGKYVFFVDSDDQLKPNCLELLCKQAEQMQADMTYGGFETFGEKEQIHHPHHKPYVMAWNKLCRRSFLVENSIRFIEGLIHEDCPWSFEVECKTRKIAVVQEPTYRYMIRKGGLQTAGKFERHFSAYCTILNAYAKTIEESIHQHRRSKDQLANWFETQKALYFTMTKERGSSKQLHELYSLIRSLDPKESFSKATAHYYMPKLLGFMWYMKFHKYHLC